MTNPVIPAVSPTSDAAAFFKATAAGQFSVPYCDDCGESHWYPRPICPYCSSDKVALRPASGRGRIYTFTVMRRAPQVFAVAYVELAEGPIMLTNMVECDVDKLAIGQEVEVVLMPNGDGLQVPMFRPL